LESKRLMGILEQVVSSSRYNKIKVSDFENEVSEKYTEQFSALTVHDGMGNIYVTFRGTDDTLIGWKENCKLAILDSVPAQLDASNYLERMAEKYFGKIYVLGHSKGGNLAVYAACNVSKKIQKRIVSVISYDGPGFPIEFYEKEGYQNIKDKITTFVPRVSIVGMLMEYAGNLKVVGTIDEGPMAHDPFTWDLCRDDFCYLAEISKKSQVFHKAITETLAEMDNTKRSEFVEELFDTLGSTGISELKEFTKQSTPKNLLMLKNLSQAKETINFLSKLSEYSIKEGIKKIL